MIHLAKIAIVLLFMAFGWMLFMVGSSKTTSNTTASSYETEKSDSINLSGIRGALYARHIITDKGLECVFAMHNFGAGVSCDWDNWNPPED